MTGLAWIGRLERAHFLIAKIALDGSGPVEIDPQYQERKKVSLNIDLKRQ